MAKNDNPHGMRLVAALRAVAGDDTANAFETELPLPKAANAEKKYAWACAACERLERDYDEPTVQSIRALCACSNGSTAAREMNKCLKKTDTIKAFVEAFNETQPAGWLEYESERSVLMCYPRCYCSCVKSVPGQTPRAWCLCTVGYARGVFAQVFGDSVSAELVESVKTGGARCAVRVRWDDKA